MDKKQAKEIIKKLEYNNNGLGRINGAYVEVVNLKILKEKVVADVILSNDVEQTYERINNCEYPIKLFKKGE